MSRHNKIRVKVEIYGKSYMLMGANGTPVEYIRKVADLVDEQMNKIGELQPSLDIPRVAVLSAVNIADDYLKLKQEWDQELQSRDEQYRQLEAEHEALQRKLAQAESEQKALEEKLAANNASVQQLREEMQRWKTAYEQSQQESAASDEVVDRYNKLQEEYRKLQTEFNDWLHLVEQDQH